MAMKFIPWLAGLTLFASASASAFTPDDHAGDWQIERIVGASDVVTAANPRTLLGTRLRLTSTTATSLEDTCHFASGAVQTISNDRLQNFVWGGQKLSGLDLPKRDLAAAFGRTETQVFYDGGKGCIEAVMLDQNHIVFLFQNGYLYLLDRASHAIDRQ